MASPLKYKFLRATIIGNALEYYDVTLYGFFAALLTPKFFPMLNPRVGILVSLGTFAAGFMMRPLGGIFFGHIGDRWGRKKALLLSIFMITIPTLIIGVLPTYDQIGFIAPLLLVICRLLQGFCTGGEYCGAAVFIAENTKKKQGSFAASLLSTSGFLGATIGTLIGALCTANFMPSWGWRIPFLLGAIFGLIGFYIRQSIEESLVFRQIEEQKQVIKIPLRKALQEDRNGLLCTFGIGASGDVPYFIISIYTNLILIEHLHLATSQIMIINTLLMVWWILFLPLMGLLADKIGKRKLMMIASLTTIIIAYPISTYTYTYLSLKAVLLMQFIISAVASAFVAPMGALIPTLFEPNRRYSGIGISYNLGAAVLGGTTPLVVASLVHYTGISTAPSFYMMFSGLIGFLAVKYAKTVSNPQESGFIESLSPEHNINNDQRKS